MIQKYAVISGTLLSICLPRNACDGNGDGVVVVMLAKVAGRSTRCKTGYSGRMMRRAPGELEGEVLTALWSAHSPMTAAEVQAELDSVVDTTVMTILARLIRKGLVVRSREDGARVYRYAPSVDRAEHAAEQMIAFLSPDEEHRAILARFLGRLGPSDRRTIADLLRRRTP